MKNQSTGALLEELRSEAWAMEPQRLQALASLLAEASRSGPPLRFDRAARAKAEEEDLYETRGRTAIVKVEGTLMNRVPEWLSYYGVDATETPRIKKALEAAAVDDQVDSVVLQVSSPGGQAQGVAEVADAIRDSAKPVDCVVSGLCASGAYWLAASARSITANKDAFVGSIGVYQVAVDSSKAAEEAGFKVHVIRSGEHKGMGVGGAPITDAQIAATQELVDGLAKLFTSSVGKGRKHALEDAGAVATGQLWLAGTAKKKGLVDKVESVASAMSRLAPEDEQEESMAKATNENTTPAAPAEDVAAKAATSERSRLADLKAAFPGDLEFAVAQFEKGATLAEAKGAFADVLQERLKAEREKSAALEAKAAQPKRSAATAAPEAGEAVKFVAGSDASPGDFMAQARALVASSGGKLKIRDAMSQVARRDPGAHQEWVESRPLVKVNVERRYERASSGRG